MRLLQFGTEPILEDDHYRYLWDGALTATGHNPYTYAPEDFSTAPSVEPKSLQALSVQAATVLDRVNYPELKTAYPPVAQSGFALAYWLSPLNIEAWRTVALLAEACMLGFVLLILGHLGRSSLWVALYWWHPLPVKEIANSLHMEPLLMLPVLLSGWLILRNQLTLSSVILAIAAGVKVWPIMLAPVLWRQKLYAVKTLGIMIGITTLILTMIFWPVVHSGLDQSSGFVAFASDWRASSSAYLVAEAGTRVFAPTITPILARLLLMVIGMVGMIWLCRIPTQNPQETFSRFAMAIALLYLLLPSQTPWYFLWVAPFLCTVPIRGLVLAGALVPLHYLYFYFAPLELEAYYHTGVVWLIWLPVWALLLHDTVRNRSPVSSPGLDRYA
ncbi:glycosyltransferase 87 family protein [Roseovarius sp. EL26]|uniref:glycosyltransferase 87 family protein n=1 Tax=Roseovarius sp. EL26 TaxID=2126672 RepID=UPI0013C5057F|nr:glycosyltransferase 87 family protein [Roseovarius sp. EL26]